MSLTACATRPTITREPVRCDEPELKGSTWADIAILAVEQREALQTCNIRNGFTPKPKVAQATKQSISPLACRLTGVAVDEGDQITGVIVDEFEHSVGTAHVVCGSGTVGCAITVEDGYEIHYEPSELDWVELHERCHALYEAPYHTREYNISRGFSLRGVK